MIILNSRTFSSSSSLCYGGWAVSLAVHSLVVLIGILLIQSVERTSFPKAFQWDVALVKSTAPVTSALAPPVEAARAAISPPSPIVSRTPTSSQSPAMETREPAIEEQPLRTAATEQPMSASTPSLQPQATPLEPVERTPPPPIEAHAAQQTVAAAQALEPSTPPAPVHATAESQKQSAETSVSTSAPPSQGAETGPPTQVASLAAGPTPFAPSATVSQGKPDFGWLSEAISKRVEELKRYPAMARADRLEGRVVVRAIVQEDGSLADVEIAKSSGHETLDRAAVEVLQQAFPLPMLKALGKPRVTIHVPLSYRLDR